MARVTQVTLGVYILINDGEEHDSGLPRLHTTSLTTDLGVTTRCRHCTHDLTKPHSQTCVVSPPPMVPPLLSEAHHQRPPVAVHHRRREIAWEADAVTRRADKPRSTTPGHGQTEERTTQHAADCPCHEPERSISTTHKTSSSRAQDTADWVFNSCHYNSPTNRDKPRQTPSQIPTHRPTRERLRHTDSPTREHADTGRNNRDHSSKPARPRHQTSNRPPPPSAPANLPTSTSPSAGPSPDRPSTRPDPKTVRNRNLRFHNPYPAPRLPSSTSTHESSQTRTRKDIGPFAAGGLDPRDVDAVLDKLRHGMGLVRDEYGRWFEDGNEDGGGKSDSEVEEIPRPGWRGGLRRCPRCMSRVGPGFWEDVARWN